MQASDQTVLSSGIKIGGFVARLAHDDLSWGEGTILPQAQYAGDADQRKLLEAVLSSIQQVADSELAYSSCTDGRIPVRLQSGEIIPVREQMVGADMVSAFYAAETLGANFYKDPAAPASERVQEVAEFLKENGLLPSSHVACGAGAGFVVIMQNALRFATDNRFVDRLRELLPEDIFDAELYDQMHAAAKARLASDVYDGLDAQTFLDAVANVSGDRAIAELKDDGRGVHGHVEELIVRVRVPAYAINEAKVADQTDGREVFGINDNRLEKLARLFARGSDSDFKKAYMALEEFADAGHGTLAKNLPTWIIETA